MDLIRRLATFGSVPARRCWYSQPTWRKLNSRMHTQLGHYRSRCRQTVLRRLPLTHNIYSSSWQSSGEHRRWVQAQCIKIAEWFRPLHQSGNDFPYILSCGWSILTSSPTTNLCSLGSCESFMCRLRARNLASPQCMVSGSTGSPSNCRRRSKSWSFR